MNIRQIFIGKYLERSNFSGSNTCFRVQVPAERARGGRRVRWHHARRLAERGGAGAARGRHLRGGRHVRAAGAEHDARGGAPRPARRAAAAVRRRRPAGRAAAQRARLRRGGRALGRARRRAPPDQRLPPRLRRRVPAAPPARLLRRRAAPAAVRGARARVDQGPSAAVHRAQAGLHARQVRTPITHSIACY